MQRWGSTSPAHLGTSVDRSWHRILSPSSCNFQYHPGHWNPAGRKRKRESGGTYRPDLARSGVHISVPQSTGGNWDCQCSHLTSGESGKGSGSSLFDDIAFSQMFRDPWARSSLWWTFFVRLSLQSPLRCRSTSYTLSYFQSRSRQDVPPSRVSQQLVSWASALPVSPGWSSPSQVLPCLSALNSHIHCSLPPGADIPSQFPGLWQGCIGTMYHLLLLWCPN